MSDERKKTEFGLKLSRALKANAEERTKAEGQKVSVLQLGREAGISRSTMQGIADGNRISRPEYYLSLYHIHGIKEADPTKIPPLGKHMRAWTQKKFDKELAKLKKKGPPHVSGSTKEKEISVVHEDPIEAYIRNIVRDEMAKKGKQKVQPIAVSFRAGDIKELAKRLHELLDPYYKADSEDRDRLVKRDGEELIILYRDLKELIMQGKEQRELAVQAHRMVNQ